jgi:hypothetical protein
MGQWLRTTRGSHCQLDQISARGAVWFLVLEAEYRIVWALLGVLFILDQLLDSVD